MSTGLYFRFTLGSYKTIYKRSGYFEQHLIREIVVEDMRYLHINAVPDEVDEHGNFGVIISSHHHRPLCENFQD